MSPAPKQHRSDAFRASVRPLVWVLTLLVAPGCAFDLAEPNGSLVELDADWRYEDHGNYVPGWQGNDFDDSGWLSGAAPLGFDCGQTTTLWFGGCAEPDGCDKPITTYFRHRFEFVSSPEWTGARLELQRDDGAVVHLNGEPIVYSALPATGIGPDTVAEYVEEPQPTYHSFDVPLSALRDGPNVVAVEVHQSAASSSDLCFSLQLVAELGGEG